MKAAEVTPEELNEIKHFIEGAIDKPVTVTNFPQKDIEHWDNIPQGVQALCVKLVPLNHHTPRGHDPYEPYSSIVVYMAYDVQSESAHTDVVVAATMGVSDVLFWTPHEGLYQLKKRISRRLDYLRRKAREYKKEDYLDLD